MQRLMTVIAAAIVACASARAGLDGDPWARLLSAAGLSRETCRFDMLDMAQWGGGNHRLPFFDAVHQDPLRIPAYARITRESIAASGGKLAPVVTLAALRSGDGTRLDLLGDPLAREAELAAKPDALLDAVRAVYAAASTPAPAALLQRIKAGQASVPADVRAAAAFALRASVRAWGWRKRALAGVRPEAMKRLWAETLAYPTDDDPADPALDGLLASVDRKRMMVGAELLAFALDGLRK
ncbi:MAG: hypothetical protein FJX72_07355, partial [Armatimonadetes bacterium]|nr:hypothetical protein [Armatimonadota bacterium]